MPRKPTEPQTTVTFQCPTALWRDYRILRGKYRASAGLREAMVQELGALPKSPPRRWRWWPWS